MDVRFLISKKQNAVSQCWNLIKVFEKCFLVEAIFDTGKTQTVLFTLAVDVTHKNNMLWILEKD